MTDLPDIGLRLHGGMEPAKCVELAKAAEANGFASVWFAENPFERGVLPIATACALATQRIQIGIGVWNPYTRHPSLIAMEIGTLDALASGRARLGIGSGLAAAIQKLKVDNKKPLGALRDTFHIVRALLRGDEANYNGAVFSAQGVRLGYVPPRPDMPIFMAARGDKALALCGQIADGLIVSNMCPPGFTAHAVEIVRRAAAAAGRTSPLRVVQYVPCVARPDGAEARRAIKPALAAMVKQYWATALAVPSAMEGLRYSGIPDGEFRTAADRLATGDAPEDVLDDRFVEAFTIAGSADDCLQSARVYARAGVAELVLTFTGADPVAEIEYLGRALKSR